MRTVINAVGYYPDISLLLHTRPACLLQIVNKPMIVHILEFLKRQGVTKCDIILSHLPQMVEELLEEGSRWGIEITYHLTQNYEYPFNSFRHTVAKFYKENILIVHGNVLPLFDFNLFVEEASHSPSLLFYPDEKWTGWAIMSAERLSKVPLNTNEEAFLTYVKSFHPKVTSCQLFLSVNTYHDLKKSNQLILQSSADSPFFPSSAAMIEAGIWLSNADDIHPKVELRSPLFIGENTQIKEGCTIGPNVVIENDCIINACSVIEDSLIYQRSYIGENLEIRNDIIDRNLLINLSLETEIVIKDAFILSDLTSHTFKNDCIKFFERSVAFIFILIFSLVILYLFIFHQIKKTQVIALPSDREIKNWKVIEWVSLKSINEKKLKNSFSNFLIELINIAKGNAQFVGLSPLSPQEVEQLPNDWRNTYLCSKIGLVTLASLEKKEMLSKEDLYSAETFYTVHKGFLYDIQLLFRALKKWIGLS